MMHTARVILYGVALGAVCVGALLWYWDRD